MFEKTLRAQGVDVEWIGPFPNHAPTLQAVATNTADFSWLTLDADLALSRARFRDHEPAMGDNIPDSVTSVAAAGISVHRDRGLFGAVRLRYFGPRPLLEDDSVRSSPSTIVNVKVGYHLDRTWTFGADILNALNSKANDQEYYYSSRLANELEKPGQPHRPGRRRRLL